MDARDTLAGAAAANLDPVAGDVPVRDDPPALVLTGWRYECVAWLALVLGAAGWCSWVSARELGWFQAPHGIGRGIAGMAAIAVAAGVLVHPPRWRRAFWMDARGLTQWRSDAYSRANEWSHVGWHDIRDVHVFNGRGAGLEVLSSRDDGIGVHDRRARPQTAAFIQAVLREAERHPRVERQPHRPLYPVPLLKPFDPAEPREGRGCMERFLWLLVSVTVVPVIVLLALDRLGLLVLVPAEFIALVLVTGFTGFRLWLKLHDSDLAYADRGGRSFRRHLRNRLRRRLGIVNV